MFQSLFDFEERGGLLPDSQKLYLQQSKQTFRHGISLCLRFDSGFLYAVDVGNMWLFKHFLRIMNTEVAFSSFITPGHSITVNFFTFQGYQLF